MSLITEAQDKFELAKQKKLKYFCHTEHKDGETFFLIEGIEPEKYQPDWAELITNKQLYHTTLRDCFSGIWGTLKPVMYRGENINPYHRGVLLRYNPYTQQAYPEIEFDDSKLKEMELLRS